MNLYLISQDENSDYDTYDSAVVCADSEEEARNMDPSSGDTIDWVKAASHHWSSTWCRGPGAVTVEYLGEAKSGSTKGVICSSFNAG